jgi:hypothetical protein
MPQQAKFVLAFVVAILNFVRLAYTLYTDARMKDKVVYVSLSRKMRCVLLRCSNTEIHEQENFCKVVFITLPLKSRLCAVFQGGSRIVMWL